MASRRGIYALVTILAMVALSGSIIVLPKSLTWKNSHNSQLLDLHQVPSCDLHNSHNSQIIASCDLEDAQLKVYMYDLPSEFHFGMLSSDSSYHSWPRNLTELPRYPGGLYQQHSPEYWLTADLLMSRAPNIRKSLCTAVLIDDPDKADVFFVPFFASLSYNRFCRRTSCVRENDKLEKSLISYLASQETWRRNGGRDHVIVMHHPNSLRIARNFLKDAMFVVADFGRYSHDVANLHKDVVAPYKHVIPTFVNDFSTYGSRKVLLYFQGAIVRKEGGIIRQQLYELLKDNPNVHFTTGNTQRDGIRSATLGMRNSKFCLHLAGDTPSSNRLFDAIASHCIPVIISDRIELPFEDELDYSEFSVFIESDKAIKKGYVIKVLTSIGSQEWTRMWEKLKQVGKHFEYQHPALPNDAAHMTWRAILRRLPTVQFAIHKTHRYGLKRRDHKIALQQI